MSHSHRQVKRAFLYLSVNAVVSRQQHISSQGIRKGGTLWSYCGNTKKDLLSLLFFLRVNEILICSLISCMYTWLSMLWCFFVALNSACIRLLPLMTMTGVSVCIKCHWFNSGQNVEVSVSKTTKESKILLLLKLCPVYACQVCLFFINSLFSYQCTNVNIKGDMHITYIDTVL